MHPNAVEANALEANAVERARSLVRDAARLVVFTGAGVSAESGVPTFRGAGGLWREFRAEDLATPEAFARDPRLVWEWYDWRRALVAACEPNAAHRAIAGYVAAHPGATVVTQNVDGLHQRAAAERAPEVSDVPNAAPSAVVALHGTLFGTRCTRCDRRAPHHERVDASSIDTLPRCMCGALLRPDVVWFGEALDPAVLDAAFGAARAADVCLVVGTSALVQPAASVVTIAAQSGAAVVEVNAEATPISARADVSLRGTAGELVPQLLGA